MATTDLFVLHFDQSWNFDATYHFDESGTLAIGVVEPTLYPPGMGYIYRSVCDIEIRSILEVEFNGMVDLDIMPLIPAKFHDSELLIAYIDSLELGFGSWLSKINDLESIINPYAVGDDYIGYLAALIGLKFLDQDTATLKDLRKQLIEAISWYKIKGTYSSLETALYLYGLTINLYDMYTNDYATFVDQDWFVADYVEENPPGLNSTYYKSPHFGFEIVFDKFYNDLTNSWNYTSVGGNDEYTTLLLHMDGTNASTLFIDSSPLGNTVTPKDNAKLSTSIKKIGTASGQFDGTGDYLTVPSDQVILNGSFETWTGLTDILTDGGMEIWTNPTTLTNWTLSGAGASVNRESTIKKYGTYSAKLTRSGADAVIYQDISSPATYDGKTFVIGAWVKSSIASQARLIISTNGAGGVLTPIVSDWHSGSGNWEYLSASGILDNTLTTLRVGLYNQISDGDVYFDASSFYEMLLPDSFTKSNGYVSREEGMVCDGTYALKHERKSIDTTVSQVFHTSKGINYWKGRTVTCGCWCWSDSATFPQARLYMYDGVGLSNIAYHTGDGTWQWLSCIITVSDNATLLSTYQSLVTVDKVAYWDNLFVTDEATAITNFGSDDFTIDFQGRFADTTQNLIFCGQYVDANNFSYWHKAASGYMYFYHYTRGVFQARYITQAVVSLTNDTFYHLELCRYGTTIKFFVNGVSLAVTELDAIGTSYLSPLDDTFHIAGIITYGGFAGYVDEFRVSKGIARHTADFTPPTVAYDSNTPGDTVYYKYLWLDEMLQSIPEFIERIRPINTVPHIRGLLTAITYEDDIVYTIPETNVAAVITTNWTVTRKYFDEGWNFDDGIYFDQSQTAFIYSISKFTVGSGHKQEPPYHDGFVIEDAEYSGSITNWIIESGKVTFEMTIPSATALTGLSELALYLPDGTTCAVAVTFPDADKTLGMELKISVEVRA